MAKEDIQESMGVTLAVTHNTEDKEPEEAPLVLWQEPSGVIETPTPSQTFNPKFILSARNTGMENGIETKGANQ